MAIANRSSPRITIRLPVRTILCLSCWRNSSRWCAVGAMRQMVDAAVRSSVAKNTVFWNCVTSAKRWLNGTTSRNANSTCTPGSATRSSPSISWRLRSSRSDSVSSRPVSGWRSCWSATGNRSDGYEREPLRAPVEREEEREPDADAPFEDRERDEDERDREPDDREPDDREPDDREPDDREPDDREPAVERDRLDAVRRLRVPPPFRSAAGISSRATAFVRVGIWPARNFAIRSSSRRISRASLAVSLSPTVSASVSIAVYVAISSCSFQNSVFAFLSIFSFSPVPRMACSGPFAADTALLAADVTAEAASPIGPGAGLASALPPSCLMRRSTLRACAFVSFRCCWRRFLYGALVVIPMCACSAVSSSFSLPYASFRYWTSLRSRTV